MSRWPDGSLRRLSHSVPTRGSDWRSFGSTLLDVLGAPAYALVAVGSALAALSLFVLSQNLGVVRDFVVFGDLSIADRLLFLYDLYPLAGPAYAPDHAVLLIGVSAGLGVNVSLTVYRISELNLLGREGVAGTAGLVLGTLGAGCAACGTAILGSVLSVLGVTGGLSLLPFDGREFLLIALFILVLSAYSLARAIRSDSRCPIDTN